MNGFNDECVCEGTYGEIETEGNRTTMGYNIRCPDSQFTIEGDKGQSTGQMKRILSAKGCDANIIDTTQTEDRDDNVEGEVNETDGDE